MKQTILCTFVALLLCAGQLVHADIVAWQGEVTSNGETPVTTHFSTVNGSSPITINVGPLSRGRAFEFIVNASSTGDTQTLLGDFTNAQALKFEQWQNTGNYGITDFGVTDFDSGVSHTTDQNIHVIFNSSGSDTEIWVDGQLVSEIGTALKISGVTGLAGAWNAGTNAFETVENLSGSIRGFASYDAELSDEEIGDHYAAFAAIPEPSSCGLIALVGLGFLRRRK